MSHAYGSFVTPKLPKELPLTAERIKQLLTNTWKPQEKCERQIWAQYDWKKNVKLIYPWFDYY